MRVLAAVAAFLFSGLASAIPANGGSPLAKLAQAESGNLSSLANLAQAENGNLSSLAKLARAESGKMSALSKYARALKNGLSPMEKIASEHFKEALKAEDRFLADHLRDEGYTVIEPTAN